MTFILEELKSPHKDGKISELHGQPLQAKAPYGPVTVIPLFHPAVVLYRQDQKQILKEDFQVLREYL
jgi:DNA polymerase